MTRPVPGGPLYPLQAMLHGVQVAEELARRRQAEEEARRRQRAASSARDSRRPDVPPPRSMTISEAIQYFRGQNRNTSAR